MRCFKVFAPLQEFNWDGDVWNFDSKIQITRLEQRPDLNELDKKLCQHGQACISNVSHWLCYEWNESDKLKCKEIPNLILISLWLAKPTRTRIAFRFELDEASAEDKPPFCLLDRFDYIQGATEECFDDNDLEAAARYYRVMYELCCVRSHQRGRLNDALDLTLYGCFSHKWHVALICYAAAAEALLTYSSEGGITRRLSKAYACLVEREKERRDSAYLEFKELYSVRSDIMHGRVKNVPEDDRLPILGRFQKVLRTLWHVVLSSPELRAVLEGSDPCRKKYFNSITSGYSPPSENS